jgi:hypothetical protein
MKKSQLVLFFCIIIILSLAFCTSLSEIKFEENPDFVNNALEYKMIHPLITASEKTLLSSGKTRTFTVEDVQSKSVYEIEVLWLKETGREGYITSLKDKSKHIGTNDTFIKRFDDLSTTDILVEMKEGDEARIKDYVNHRVEISNPLDSSDYIILGQVEFFTHIVKESDKTSFHKEEISFPIELGIYEEGIDVGKVILGESRDSDDLIVIIDIYLHDRFYKVEFQELLNKRKVSVEVDDELIAFFDLKPASFITTKLKGNALIKAGMSSEITADIFSAYILTAIVLRGLSEDYSW